MANETEWNPRIGVTHTIRESILIYLSQQNEYTPERDLRSILKLERKEAKEHLKYLEEGEFVEKQFRAGGENEYILTTKGEELVRDIHRSGQGG